MKKILLILIILLLTGCYDYTEIDDLIIITGILLDYKDNNYYLTTELLENENESNIKIYNTKGNTIEECISKISKYSNKKVTISHLKSLLLTKNLITSNTNYIDYFLRNNKSKMNFYVYYVEDDLKDKIFEIQNNNNGTSLYIKDIIDFNNITFQSSTPISFLDIVQKKLEYGIEPIYPNISIKDDKLYLDKLISFNSNNELIILDDNEAIIYNILTNNINKTNIEIKCEDDLFSIDLKDLDINYKWNNSLNINIKLDSKLSTYNCKYNLNSIKTIKKLNNLSNIYLKRNIEKLINKEKEKEIDFIGFGNYIYKYDPKYFDFKNKNWNKNLKNINFNINVKTNIVSLGEVK